jgi:hypothetical protein
MNKKKEKPLAVADEKVSGRQLLNGPRLGSLNQFRRVKISANVSAPMNISVRGRRC